MNADYVLEDEPDGRTLVITGRWAPAAAEVLQQGDVDGLTLNYARGFKGKDLEFLDATLGVRRLNLLDRGIVDLAPIARLSESLERLSIQAAERAELDLGALPHLQSVAAEWSLIGATLSQLDDLRSAITWRFTETDAHAFRDHIGLQQLTIKDAPFLESLSGLGDLRELTKLGVMLAHRLADISDIAGTAPSLRDLELEKCRGLNAIEDIEALVNLRFFGFSDCGDLNSLAPLEPLVDLEVAHLWGSTRVLDGDLSPLARLPRLRELRMRDRRDYRPHVGDLAPSHF